MRKAAALVLSITMIMSSFSFASAEDSHVTDETKITGVRKVFNIGKNTKAKDAVTITHPAGRELLVQKETKKGWKTYKTIQLGDDEKQKVTISYPKQWKNSTYSEWRLYIDNSSDKNKEYNAAERSVRFIVKNLVTKKLKSSAGVIMDEDGYIIFEKKPNQRRHQASVTKMMTALLNLEHYKKNQVVKISSHAAARLRQKHPLKKGMKFTKETLMNVMLLSSYNASALALAESKSGTEQKFVKRMNKKASQLKMKNTHYYNSHGLYTKKHYSSALDSAKLLKECFKYPEFRKIVSRNTYPIVTTSGKRIATSKSTYYEIKKIIGPSLLGGKSGYAVRGGSGRNFAGVYKVHGKLFYVATLGAHRTHKVTPTMKCWSDHKMLFKYIKMYGE
ncbi:MAG: D-alanyl-D-alanine carboxypeptidase [Firmicutes bacterium]|nr:D-alanyl-D-alanine carboxypeptidase [Bacillota bacterium]